MKTRPELTDVPETMLWTLHNRATEAMRPDAIIEDRLAVEIYQSLDYDYLANFGRPNASHAVRSVVFDNELRAFLALYPDATIVNLGEGLETQRFRIRENRALWLCVDLPEAIDIRERFIQPDARHRHLALSATDPAWFEAVPGDKPVFITAQGLFIYFTEETVKTLLQDVGRHFPTATLMFDTVPVWLARKTRTDRGLRPTKGYVAVRDFLLRRAVTTARDMRPATGYAAPEMHWGINRNDIQARLSDWLWDGAEITDLGYSAFPRGTGKWITTALLTLPWVRNLLPSIVRVRLNALTPGTTGE